MHLLFYLFCCVNNLTLRCIKLFWSDLSPRGDNSLSGYFRRVFFSQSDTRKDKPINSHSIRSHKYFLITIYNYYYDTETEYSLLNIVLFLEWTILPIPSTSVYYGFCNFLKIQYVKIARLVI